MKWLYGFGIVVSLFLGFFILCQFPIMKVRTPMAMANIEQRFLRQDLSMEDKKSYEFEKMWILGNQSSALLALDRARGLGFAVCLVLLVTSIAGLVCESRRAKAEPSDEPNGASRRRLS